MADLVKKIDALLAGRPGSVKTRMGKKLKSTTPATQSTQPSREPVYPWHCTDCKTGLQRHEVQWRRMDEDDAYPFCYVCARRYVDIDNE